ncbi:MAG: YlbF family regulator [Lachnospiraceae bacterium]|nr:YlbF family regulator [Lachnospiraceae bacterium]
MLDVTASSSGMKEIEQSMDELIALIHTSDLCQQMNEALAELKKDEALYAMVNEYRTRRFYEKTSGQESWDDSLSELRQQCMAEPLAARFLAAELEYCRLLRRIGRQFYDGMRFDLEFLEES